MLEAPLLSHPEQGRENGTEKALMLFGRLIAKKKAQKRQLRPSQAQLSEIENRLPQEQRSYRGKPLLSAFQPEPEEDVDIDDKMLENYAMSFDDEKYQKMAKKLKGFVFHLTYPKFLKALKDSVIDFEYRFKTQFPGETYIVGIEPGHSLQWVAGLAMRYLALDNLPSQVAQLGESYGVGRNFLPADPLPDEGNRIHLVLFDDCAYSGSQLSEKIIDKYKEYCQNVQSEFHLHIIVPFMTTYSALKIKENLAKSSTKLKVHLYNSRILPTITQLPLAQEDCQNLALMAGGDGYNAIKTLSGGKTLMYSDWKNPDAWSVPWRIMDGNVPTMLKSTTGELQDTQFIPKVKKPYGKN